VTETTNEETKKPKLSKKMIVIIAAAAVLLVGGGVLAFVFTNLSEKQNYFLAEKNTIDFMVETFEERYQPEMDWYEHTEENPTSQTVELSAEYNDPSSPGTNVNDPYDPAQMINNSSITVTSQQDMQNQQIAASVMANIAGIEIDPFDVYITAEELLLGMPFLDNVLQISDEDFGPMMHELDPTVFTGEESLQLESVFEGYPEEDLNYFYEEYALMIYDELPDEAFKSSDESIQINDDTVNAEKITFHLTEEQLKNLLITVFDKLENDEHVKEMLREQLANQQIAETEIDEMIREYEEAMADAQSGLEGVHFPEGMTSTIWIHQDVIAQREFHLGLGPSAEEVVDLTVNGTQSLENNQQTFDYEFGFADAQSEGTMNITGDLVSEDDQITDSINLTVEDVTLSYEGSETLTDGTRDFERVFSLDDSVNSGSLTWGGIQTFDNDQMNGEHQLSIHTPDMNQDIVTLHLLTNGETIDSVEMPAEENITDLGSMSADELNEYAQTELMPNFQQWLFGIMVGSGELGI